MNLFQCPVPTGIFVSVVSSAAAGCSSSPGLFSPGVCWLLLLKVLAPPDADPLLLEECWEVSADNDDGEDVEGSCISIVLCFFQRRFSRVATMAFAIAVPSIMELAR